MYRQPLVGCICPKSGGVRALYNPPIASVRTREGVGACKDVSFSYSLELRLVSIFEESSGVVPHAGICAGAFLYELESDYKTINIIRLVSGSVRSSYLSLVKKRSLNRKKEKKQRWTRFQRRFQSFRLIPVWEPFWPTTLLL